MRRHVDPTGEVTTDDLRAATLLSVGTDAAALAEADFIIVAVPTPVDDAHQPDFGPLLGASQAVGANMKRGATVVYESTVYPGATEEICIPVLEKHSGMKWMTDFHVGYSPERINPGDKERTLTKITKVVSGDSPETLELVAQMYGSVVTAGVHRASSIKVAEAAKVIENTQRDLNIALMNELAIIFDRLGIDTMEVLRAAGTKWNFLPFRPGLVGGHCIGVDPYYLTHKAEMVGYHPEVILAGRRINDGMGKFVAEQTVKHLVRNGWQVKDAPVIVLGLTFKEDCPDLRNSRVIDVIRELQSYGADGAGARPGRRAGGGVARVRRGARAVGAAAQGGGDRGRRRASRVQGPADLRLSRAAAAEGGHRRREEPVRRRRSQRQRRHRVAAVRRELAMSAIDDVRRQLTAKPLRWLVTGSAGFIGSHLVQRAARARPDGRRTGQFRHRPPAQSRRGSRDGDRRAMAPPPLHRGGHSRSRRLPARVPRHRRRAAPGGARIGSALARRSDRDQRGRTSTASSTCWSPRATPACGDSSTRRRARPTATTRRCPRSRTSSAGRSRRTRSPSSSTSSTPTCSRAATACSRSVCATSTSSARGRIRTARTPR